MVKGAKHLRRFLAPGFHHVNLSRRWPTAILLLLRQHPQSRPDALARGELGAELELAVPLVEERAAVAFSSFQPGRSVAAAVVRFLHRPNVEHPILDERVLRFARVILELVVAPPADPDIAIVIEEAIAEIEIP